MQKEDKLFKNNFELISNTKLEILKLLLESEEERYIREIARILKKSPIYIKKELDKMLSAGIVLEKSKANLRLFQINKTSPIFNEIKNFILKTK